MPEQIFTFRQEMAGGAAGGNGGETGQSTGSAGKLNPTKEGENKTDKKDKKSMLGSVGKMLTGVLGIQVTFAAMLRQSQIATGFLGAVFQVLGAILDSFLLAFAPQLFSIVEHLANLIPIARAIGEEVALQVGNLWERIVAFTAWFTPIAVGIWDTLKGIFKWFSDLAPIWKWSLVALYAIPRLLAFMKAGFFLKMGKVIFFGAQKALAVHRAKSAATGGAGKGVMGMLTMIPHVKIIMIALAVVAVVGTAIWAMFKSKGTDDNAAGAIDVSGQLGKKYMPSQASQLGGSLNEAYSAVIKPFTDAVTPEVQTFGGVLAEVNPHAAAAAEEMAKLAAVIPIDEYGLTITAMDAMMNAEQEAQQAILDAADNWAGNLGKNSKIQIDEYALLVTGQDASIAALERQQKAIEEANTNWKVGSEQSKNQWMSTASFAHDGVVEASDKVKNLLAKGDMERAMGSMVGAMEGTSDAFLMMFNQDAKALKDAADKQKSATIAFEVMTQTVMNGYTQDRAEAKAQREEIGTALLGADNPALAYLSSNY